MDIQTRSPLQTGNGKITDDLFAIVDKQVATNAPIEDISFRLYGHDALYTNRDRAQELELVRQIKDIVNKVSILCTKADDLFHTDYRTFDSKFTKEELMVYDQWLAPLHVGKDEALTQDLIDKMHIISMARVIQQKKGHVQLLKNERSFLKEYGKTELTQEEKGILSRNRSALRRAMEKRIGASRYGLEAMWYARAFLMSYEELPLYTGSDKARTLHNALILHYLDMFGKIQTDENESIMYQIRTRFQSETIPQVSYRKAEFEHRAIKRIK